MASDKELARVDQAEAYWLHEGLLDTGRMVIVIQGKKPTPFHRIDIIQLDTELPSFAATWYQDGEFSIPRETPYAYTETFATRRVDEIVILCKGADGAAQERKIKVARLESNSLRRLHESSGRLAGFQSDTSRLPPFVPQISRVSRQHPQFPTPARFAPYVGRVRRPDVGSRVGTKLMRNDGDFGASVSFYDVGYAACQAFVQNDEGQRWTLHGQGGGAPGFGGYTGIINTSDLERLIGTTTSCAIEGWTFYGTIQFFDAGANVLGWFHGGGFGIGAGGYSGHWEPG